MADTYTPYDPTQDPSNPAYAPTQPGEVTNSDRAKAVISGAADVGAGLGANVRATGDALNSPAVSALGDFFRSSVKLVGDSASNTMSDEAKQQLQSSIASPEFWNHPISAAFLKTINMAPSVAAAVVPAVLFPEGVAAQAAAVGSGAEMGAGQSEGDVYDQTDAMTDAQLQKAMPYYAGLRSMGISEDQARAQANTKLMGLKPLLNAAAGGAAMALGPAGRLAGIIPEEAGAGLLTRAAVGGAEGATGGALMGGVGEATKEQTQVDLDERTQLDPGLIAAATFDSALTQGVMGVAGGTLTTSHETAPNTDAKPKEAPQVENVQARAPDAGQSAALAADQDTQSAPTAESVTQQVTGEPAAPKAPEPVQQAAPAAPEPVVTPPPAAPVPSSDDAGKTVPEAAPTLQAQRDQLVAGQRQAMLFPKGGDAPLPVPDGMKQTVTKDGTFHYNPDQLKPADIYAASKSGDLNKILGLGDYSKADIAPKIAAGETPVAVTERQPDGTEVKAAAGTTSTAPDQVKSLEASKTPGNTVQVESPENVLIQRAKAAADSLRQKSAPKAPEDAAIKQPTPRVTPKKSQQAQVEPIHTPDENLNELPPQKMAEISAGLERLWQVAEQQEANGTPIKGGIEAFIERKKAQLIAEANAELGSPADKPAAPRARPTIKNEGKHYTKDQIAARVANRDLASNVLSRFEATDGENLYRNPGMAGDAARQMISERAKGMVEAAEREGVKIPAKIKDTTDKAMEHPPSVVLLNEAKRLSNVRNGAKLEDYDRFLTREKLLRTGDEADRAQVLAERRAEGDAQWAQTRERQIEKLQDPEAVLAAERERLESVPDEGSSTSEEGEGEEAQDETQAQAPPEQERPAVTLKGNEVNAVKDRAGTFKVETKKRIIVKRLGDENEHVPLTLAEIEGVKPIRTYSLHEALDNAQDMRGALNEKISPYIEKRLRAIVGDVPVHIVSPGDMKKLAGDSALSLGTTRGLFVNELENGHKAIYINSKELRNTAELRNTLLHEGMHAAVESALENSPEHRATVQMMLDEVKANIGIMTHAQNILSDGSYLYGLKDVHEFMSEAMSNPHFQDLLGSIPASRALVKRLQLNSPLTLRDALVHAIRKILGFSDGQQSYSIIEAALRTSNQLMAAAHNEDLGAPRLAPRFSIRASRLGDFSAAGDAGKSQEINDMFRSSFSDMASRASGRTVDGAKEFVSKVTNPAKAYASAIETAHGAGNISRKILNAVTTNDQYRAQIEKLLPMAKQIFDANEKTGVYANKLKEEGVDLTGMLMRAQRENPELFEKFAALVNEQTMHGVDASVPIGEGRNAHLQLPKGLLEKIEKGQPVDDVAHEAAMRHWQAREEQPGLAARYKEIVRADPEYAKMQSHLFDYYEKSQSAIVRDQIERILQNYGYKGTDEERGAAATSIYKGKLNDVTREGIASKLEGNGDTALKQIEATKALRVMEGPYAPQMRRGEHAVIGEYKVKEPTNGTKINDSTWEFKDRKAAHDFAVGSDLHAEPKIVYYDTATGKQVKSKSDAISQVGEPEQRYQIRLQRQHLEFHESESDAKASMEDLKKSGLFDKLGLEERRHIESEQSQFSDRGVESLLRSLSQQKNYQDSTPEEREALRSTIREAGVRSMSDNRVQSRRLPRRYVQGASDDIARNLYDYSNSQANYRAQMKFRQAKDDGLKAMWDHVKANRFTPDNEQRSAAANEVERRMRQPDPNQYSGAYTDWTRRLSTWSYIDRMARPSHLILHQTHLPMITAPYMAGRHGLMNSFGTTLKAWKELTGFYKSGGKDFAESMADSLHKGTNYADVAKKAFAAAPDGKRISQMLDAGTEMGWLHPSSGIEVHKYLPSKQLSGVLGGMDRGLSKIDTVFRQLTNATEAVNRMAGATAAYRMEFKKLTQAGKSEADAHQAAMEYARQVITTTQGLFSSTNAAPLFKNKVLKPFLQFKQFPQMMYHMLSKLAVTALKGETREARIEALSSLGSILGMHMMMAGVLQGLPLEPFKLLGLISKGIGLTDGDWSDVENAVMRKLNDTFGKQAGDVLTRGLGAQMGVDVHHRLGLNSFITYGMPEQLDSKSVSEFLMNAVVGAPGGLVTDAVKGTHKMLTGDIEGGALQAVPLQAFRDIHQAIAPADNKYGYQATGADRVKSLMGFTPEAKAEASEKKEAVYNATQAYDTQRNNFIKNWTSSAPAEREEVWQKIQAWNQGRSPSAQLNKGDLFKALQGQARSNQAGSSVAFLKTNAHNKDAAQQAADLYQ